MASSIERQCERVEIDADGAREPQDDGSGTASGPSCLLERTLVAYPDAFGKRYERLLFAAWRSAMQDGDEESREILRAHPPREVILGDRARIDRVLVGLPSEAERRTPALLLWGDGLSIALAHRVPYADPALSIRLEVGSRESSRYLGAVQVDPTDRLLEHWRGLGYTAPPQSVWRCDPPERLRGRRDLAVELVPNPRGFNQAMLIGRYGVGRVLVPEPCDAGEPHDSDAMPATVMASGWTYTGGDLPIRGGSVALPIAAPRPSRKVRIPDPDLFALCAAMTWPSTLRDSIWLRRRPDFRMLA